MKLKWKILLITGLIIIIGGIPATFMTLHFREQRQALERNARALALAQQLLVEGDASAACSVVALQANHLGPFASEWLEVDIESATQAPHPARLQWLASRHPQAIREHEQACQVLAAAEWAAGDRESAARIANPWLNMDTMNRGWLPIALRLAQHSDEGISAAENIARTFSQRSDRRDAAWGFIHLALMHPDNRARAALHLDQAFEADPTIPELRSFRANMLEEQGLQKAALTEYEAAVICEPSNPVWRDNLAEAHIRAGNVDRATAAWAMACVDEAQAIFGLKPYFGHALPA